MYYIDFFVSRSDFYKKPFPNIGLKSIEEFFSDITDQKKSQQTLGLSLDDKIKQQTILHDQNQLDSKQLQEESKIKIPNQVILKELSVKSQDSQNLNKKLILFKGAKTVKQLVGKILHIKNYSKSQGKKRKNVKCTCKKNQCFNLYCGCYQIQKHCTKSCKCKKIECHNMPNTDSQLYQQSQ
ncbi:unnamed protein product [Paramecium sonneborni]|uniref:CRC domain-containing protein n=1 Tax=Paramecium sonneborni TaxID=65129 RepID=A0A8S1R9S3_9CILI|nr:unnamed protein product [Paramecium sonneborni]